MKEQILIVAPFEALAEEAAMVIAERMPEARPLFRIIEADLQEAKRRVQEAARDGIEVIVSRGGTAALLAETTALPVVKIQVSIMDVLRAVREEGGPAARKIGIAGFENVIYGCHAMADILRMEFVEILLKRPADAEEKIARAIAEGVDMIIGDAVSVRVARAHGLRARFIESGRQAVLAALQEALLIARVRRQMAYKSQMLGLVVDKLPDGIVAVDGENVITLFNPEAELIFGRAEHEALGCRLHTLCPSMDGARLGRDEEFFLDVGRKQYLVRSSHIPASGETIFIFQNISEVQRMEQSIRKKLRTRGLAAKYHLKDIVGPSEPCLKMKRKAEKYALTDSTILVTGASGTGKEILVQGIHNLSRRAKGPFVAVNCAALPENLLESELFGYKEGAFTGARKGGRQGLFELAHHGTMFLDEIGEMPLSLQTRLLRVLQEREVMPLGGESVVPVDVRVVAATNQDLARMVEEGRFRRDLYYRLNILRIHMPTLAERREDIPVLARYLMRRMKTVNPRVESITDEALAMLMRQDWPGNVRQFMNMMERILLLEEGTEITRASVAAAYEDDVDAGEARPLPRDTDGASARGRTEEENIRRVLAEENYNYSRAAARLGIHRVTLWRKIKRLETSE